MSLISSSGALVALSGAIASSGLSGQLPAGHWVAAKMSLAVVHPRPDNETGSFAGTVYARHRLAYYDGSNAIQYECPVAVQGGARPLIFTLIAGPAWLNIGQAYGSSYYGVLYGTPTGTISTGAPVTVTVRVYGQDLATIDVTFTIATSSSTADFIFVNSSTGNDSTGNGTFGTPYATLAKVMGSNTASTTFPAARIYLSGSFQWPVQTGATSGYFDVDRTKIPAVYLALPGSSASIDASLVQLEDAGSGWDDLWFSGSGTSRLSINGSGTALDTHTFELYNCNRCTWWNVDFVNPINRANGSNTNSTSIFTSNSGVIKNYYTIVGSTETGRSGAAGNSMLMTSMFSVQNVVFESNTARGQSGFGVFFKDSNRNITAAYNIVELQPDTTSSGSAFLFGCQQNNQTAMNLEACYNFVIGTMIFDFQSGANAGAQYSYRNTIYAPGSNYNYGLGNFGPGGTGPYTSNNDVIVAKSPGGVNGSSTVLFTSTGTEVEVAWSGSPPPANCPINTTTGALVDASTAWRTLYLGIRGWEVG